MLVFAYCLRRLLVTPAHRGHVSAFLGAISFIRWQSLRLAFRLLSFYFYALLSIFCSYCFSFLPFFFALCLILFVCSHLRVCYVCTNTLTLRVTRVDNNTKNVKINKNNIICLTCWLSWRLMLFPFGAFYVFTLPPLQLFLLPLSLSPSGSFYFLSPSFLRHLLFVPSASL